MAIERFEGKYRFLSNFTGGIEHKFQAAKTTDPEVKRWILDSPTPNVAKRRGKSARTRRVMRPDWDQVKDGIMYRLVKDKFKRWPYKDWLLKTGDEELIEGNWWKDRYWGVCGGYGENRLGKILMRVRDELRKAQC